MRRRAASPGKAIQAAGFAAQTVAPLKERLRDALPARNTEALLQQLAADLEQKILSH